MRPRQLGSHFDHSERPVSRLDDCANATLVTVLARGLSGLRLSEFVLISEFFRIYITDICQTSESFAKSVNLK